MLESILPESLTTTVIAGIVAVLVIYMLIQKWKYKYPPGPTGLPLIGNLLQISHSEIHEQTLEWSKKYGPVMTIRLGPIPFVFVTKIDAALEVLVKKSTDFAGRLSSPSIDVITYGGKDISFGQYGPTWKHLRKIASKAVRNYVQGDQLERRVHTAVTTAFDEIDKLSGPFDPVDYINFIVGNIMTSMCFGRNFDDKEVSDVLKMDDDLIEIFGAGTLEDAIPALKYVYKTEKFKAVEDLANQICEEYIRKRLTEVKKTFDRDNPRHFADYLLLAKLEEEEGKDAVTALTDDYVVQTINDVYMSGLNSMRSTMGFAVLHMIAFPDIQEKVQQEIDRVVGKDRLPGLEDRPHLGYTEAVLHESMRLSSVLPSGLFHKTRCDTELSGYKLPKETVVVINQWALHHDPEAWEEVDRFIPERFLDEDGMLGPKPKNWMPFSVGKRGCLGENISKAKMHLMFASLMQRYIWKMESGRCPELRPKGSSFLLSAKPYKAIAKRRI